MSLAPVHAADEILLGFARALRAAGVNVTADRERTYLEAVDAVGADDQSGAYWAGRATLCASPADLERYDQVYAAWFGLERAASRPRRDPTHTVTQASLDAGSGRRRGPGAAGGRRPGGGERGRGAAPPRRRVAQQCRARPARGPVRGAATARPAASGAPARALAAW